VIMARPIPPPAYTPVRTANSSRQPLGAWPLDDGSCTFTLWGPFASNVEIILSGDNRSVLLSPQDHGFHSAAISGVEPGTRYMYRLDGKKQRPDPASRYQPDGVFGPSEVVQLSDFSWTDGDWHGLELQDYIFYELHVGTYTASGTLDGIIEHLSELKSLGITAIELMPLAQFSGTRNWGYDGVFPFAVQNNYGGPRALQRLVNACHTTGLAVVLDVVYNHLGPEGNFLGEFAPYFTDRYRTPWGQAVNFDGAHSDHVIRYFMENALGWLRDFHIDALRLDAIHGIVDRSAQPFLAMLSSAVDELAKQTGRHIHLIAESDLNDSRFVTSRELGGYGLHGQWNDDFHHALHCLQTGERFGYYRDFGSLRHLEKAIRQGYVYTGEYSEYRQRRHGNSPEAIGRSQLVVFSQNHDQIGNRVFGDRAAASLSLEAQKLSAGSVLLSPYLPLLFMGEEYGEEAPFQYFTSHSDPQLAQAVREGRRDEFKAFFHEGDPPDPQVEATFERSRVDHELRQKGTHQTLWNFYRELIRLRKEEPPLRELDASEMEVADCGVGNCLRVRRRFAGNEIFMLFNFTDNPTDLACEVPPGYWHKCLDSADTLWAGQGSAIPNTFSVETLSTLTLQPKSFCVLKRVQCV